MHNIKKTQIPAPVWHTEFSKLTKETARLARGAGNPSYERPTPATLARGPLARAIERFAATVAEKILRTAGTRKVSKNAPVHITKLAGKKGAHQVAGKSALLQSKAEKYRADATPAKTFEHLRPELKIEARSAIGARIAMNPALGQDLIARKDWPKPDIRAVFGDTQKIFRHFRRGAQNLCADAPELTDAQRAKNGLAIAAQEHDTTAQEQKTERIRFARLRLVLRALHAWRIYAQATGQRNVTRGFDAARALVADALAGNPLGKDYLDAYQALREKVVCGLGFLGWSEESAYAFLPASLPATPCSVTAKTV